MSNSQQEARGSAEQGACSKRREEASGEDARGREEAKRGSEREKQARAAATRMRMTGQRLAAPSAVVGMRAARRRREVGVVGARASPPRPCAARCGCGGTSASPSPVQHRRQLSVPVRAGDAALHCAALHCSALSSLRLSLRLPLRLRCLVQARARGSGEHATCGCVGASLALALTAPRAAFLLLVPCACSPARLLACYTAFGYSGHAHCLQYTLRRRE